MKTFQVFSSEGGHQARPTAHSREPVDGAGSSSSVSLEGDTKKRSRKQSKLEEDGQVSSLMSQRAIHHENISLLETKPLGTSSELNCLVDA